ncbi:MAG TPA: FUSC family protein [Paucimonas sp.]|nr:FUSC family protein [Paucimonas sp.]HJW55911.1 FUSC family protein [Burkholderiaceae bacterium]
MMRAAVGWLAPDRTTVSHALALFVAAISAFAIASLFHVQNAYWAVMPVWAIAQTRRGLMLERAFFRVSGTLIGAAAGFGILQAFNQPYLALAILAAWIALNSGLTHLLRGVHSYGALMAGITAAVVVLPSLLSPGQSLAIALARVECTLIGVVVVTLVTGLFTRDARRHAFYMRVRKLAGDAVAYAADLLQNGPQEGLERRILTEISEVEAMATMVAAGSLDGYRRMRHVTAFIAASLAMMAAGQALQRRRSGTAWAADPLPGMLSGFAERLRTGRLPDAVLHDLQELIASARLANTRLAFALEQLIAAEDALFSEERDAQTGQSGTKTIRLAPHREWTLARRTALVSGGVTFAGAALGIGSGWPEGELAALGVCIFSMILGSMPKPQAIAPAMLKGVSAGVVFAIFYRFVVQPHVATVPELVLSVAPFMLIGAFARANRRTTMPALDANMCFLLASQAVLPAVTDPSRILGGAFALLLAAAMVTGGFILLPRSPASLASDAACRILNDLRRLVLETRMHESGDWQPHALRQILRLMLHLGRADDLRRKAPKGLLATLNLGNAIVDMHALSGRPGTDRASAQALAQALALLADTTQDSRSTADKFTALAEISEDAAIAEVIRDAAHALRQGETLFELGRTGKL